MGGEIEASDATQLARVRLGRTLKGKWRLERVLGVGGTAAVYEATHRNGARVAIKMLHAVLSTSAEVRARFLREAYLANKVQHPSVVRVLDDDIDETDQSAFLVMDLVRGVDLAERALDRLLDEAELLDVAEQVLSVLEVAHAEGIVHRDLKPENLLLDAKGRVHVLDFGIARLVESWSSATPTKTGATIGTPGFMAPELALGKTHLVSARTDVWSLGATLFALASGLFVFDTDNQQELIISIATQNPRSLAEVAEHLPASVVRLIDKATRLAPEDRWSSAQEMLAEVRRLRVELGCTSTRVLPLQPVEHEALRASPTTLAPPPVVDTPVALKPIAPAPRASGMRIVVPFAALLVATLGWIALRRPPEAPPRMSASASPSPSAFVVVAAPPAIGVSTDDAGPVVTDAAVDAPAPKPSARKPLPKPIDLGY